jgi:hypothetical protein
MRRGLAISLKVAIMLVIFVLGFGTGVHYLWNWLMPSLFGLHAITFWQAVGLLGLSWILFRGPMMFARRGWGGGGRRAERLRQWAAMTPEQREQFRRGMKGRCGRVPPEPTVAADKT